MPGGLMKQACITVVFIVCSLLSTALNAQNCANIDNWQRVIIDDDSLLISLLRVNSQPVSASLDVYAFQDTYLFSVSALSEALQLGWQINKTEHTLSSNNQTSVTQLCDFSISLSEKASQSSEYLVWAEDDFDLYIDIATLPLLLGGSAEYVYNLLQMNIKTDVDFAGLIRKQKLGASNLVARSKISPDRTIVDQYRLLTPPLVNYRLTGNYNSAQSNSSIASSVNAFFDVAHHATELRVNTTAQDSRQFLRFSKNLDISGEDQAINYLRYEVGDVQLQSDELIYRAKQALGVSVFNFDPNYSRSFSQVTIDETMLPGWRAQLFRNGQFLQESFSSNDNRVVFEQVDTYYGNNLFEIKLYGPEGQQEVRQQTINVGTEQLNPGVFNYYFNVSDAGKRFIDSDSNDALYDQNISGLLSYGINEQATIEGSIHVLKGLGTEQHFLSSALYVNFANSLLKTQVVKDVDAGNALFVGLNSNFGRDLKINFSGRYFNDFVSDAYQENRDIRGEARLRLNGQLAWWDGVSWSSAITHRAYNERIDNNVLSLSMSKNLLGGTFSSSLAYNDGLSDQVFQHNIYYSKNFSGWQISNSLQWLPADSQEIRNYYSNIRWPQRYATYNESRIEYRANQDDKMLFSHRVNWRQDAFNLQFGATVTDGGEWTINLGISGDIEYDTYKQNLSFYRPRGSSVANIHALAYLDQNRNSIFDEQDQVLSDVQIKGHSNWRSLRTNAQGNIQLATNSRIQSVQIDETSLPDPYMLPVDKLVRVNTHGGGISRVELPVVTFNDLEGAIYRVKNSNSRGVSGLAVQLLDEQLNVVAQSQTEVDGYFFFTRIPPGQYALQLDPEYIQANNLSIENLPEFIDAPAEGDSMRLNDLLLIEKGSPEDTPEKIESLETEANSFYVQLGAFKKPKSIIEVIKYLPTEEYDLRIFRNHKTGLSYVVMGGYANISNAQKAIQNIKHIKQFGQSYVNNGTRYFSADWDLEYELLDITEHLQASYQFIKKAKATSYFCQLASYRSLTSISSEGLNGVKVMHVVRRNVNQQRFYTLYTGPVSRKADCYKEHINIPTLDKVFPVATHMLQSQLVAEDH